MGGEPGALKDLSALAVPFHAKQVSGVLYAMFDAKPPDRWRNAMPILHEHFMVHLDKSAAQDCARSLLAPRIENYPQEAWAAMLEMGWVDALALKRISAHKPTMKSWARGLLLAEASGKSQSASILERLGWLCHAGFDPSTLHAALQDEVSKSQGWGEAMQSITLQSLRALEQQAHLDRATPAVAPAMPASVPRL